MNIERVLVVGASGTPVCGVRDHARILGHELEQRGVEVARAWWEPWRGHSLERWIGRFRVAAERSTPDWIVWHYSVFTYGYRGVPTLARRIALELARLAPVALFVHEYAYPFGVRGWRGFAQAITQRAAFGPVLRASTACVVTVDRRRDAIAGAWYLPGRPLAVIPVFSNLPEANGRAATVASPTIGVFGFAHATPLARTIGEAVRGLHAQLLLIGAPGAESEPAETWRQALVPENGERLAFTGVLEPQDLATAIASVDVALFADPAGPASRKGTLAALLGAGKPIVAVDGPDRWGDLVRAGAVVVAAPAAEPIARELERLLLDEEARREQADRAAEFYSRKVAPAVAADSFLRFLETARP